MTRKKLKRIWQDIAAARRSLPKLSDLEDLARRCGRSHSTGGKHVMWKSDAFPEHRAFPIPRHGGGPTASYAVRDTVLDHLEADAVAWEELLDSQELEADDQLGDDDDSC